MGFSTEEIIQRLKQIAKVELISDAFDKLGVENKIIPSSVSQIEPRYNYSQSLCGRAYTVLFSDINDERGGIGSETRFYLDKVPQNVIVVIHNEVGTQYSTWGELLSTFAEERGILGTITDGSLRDIDDLHDLKYPIFSAGLTPVRGTGRYKVTEVEKTIVINGVEINSGDYILAARSGIAVIDPKIVDKVIELAETKKKNESIIKGYMKSGMTLFEIDQKMKSTEHSQSIVPAPQ